MIAVPADRAFDLDQRCARLAETTELLLVADPFERPPPSLARGTGATLDSNQDARAEMPV
jgi:hypothetical protein